MLKNLRNKSLKYFTIILFIGHFSSITLFVHTHIVDGLKITHSHPYNPFKGDKGANHNHSRNEIFLIEMLSQFLSTTVFVVISIKIAENFINRSLLKRVENIFSKNFFLNSNGLRAPPLNIYI